MELVGPVRHSNEYTYTPGVHRNSKELSQDGVEAKRLDNDREEGRGTEGQCIAEKLDECADPDLGIFNGPPHLLLVKGLVQAHVAVMFFVAKPHESFVFLVQEVSSFESVWHTHVQNNRDTTGNYSLDYVKPSPPS